MGFRIGCLLVFLGSFFGAEAQRLLEQRVEPSGRVTVGDRLVLVLTVDAPPGVQPLPAVPHERGNERVWGSSSVERQGPTRWRVYLPFQVFRVGEVSIPPVNVVVGGSVLTTEAAAVVVRTVREGADADNLREVKPPVPVREFPWSWLLVAGGGVALFLWGRRPKRKTGLPELPLSPEEWVEREFSRLEAETVGDRESLRRFVASAADIVREYLERKAGIPAPQRTTRRTLEALAPVLTRETRHRLEEVLRAADFVKFSGHVPADHIARLYLQRARETVAFVASDMNRKPVPCAS